jgi:hypothetical protein
MNSMLVVPGRTELVVEAFPRSSNSFMVRLLRAANPGLTPETMCHHTHSIHSVKRGLRAGAAVLVIIRNPADAIISCCIARNNFDPTFVSLMISQYLDFYSWLRQNVHEVVLIRFEDVIGGDLNEIAGKLNERFGTHFATGLESDELRRRVEQEVRAGSPNRDRPDRIPIPTDERRELSRKHGAAVRDHPRIGEAERLYRELLEKIEATPDPPIV